MPRAEIVKASDGNFYGIHIECPGCDPGAHVLPVRWVPAGMVESSSVVGGPHWSFNGDFENPTFEPSILSRWTWGKEQTEHVCHSFVRDGNIQFLADCTHALAGKTVPLPRIS